MACPLHVRLSGRACLIHTHEALGSSLTTKKQEEQRKKRRREEEGEGEVQEEEGGGDRLLGPQMLRGRASSFRSLKERNRAGQGTVGEGKTCAEPCSRSTWEASSKAG